MTRYRLSTLLLLVVIAAMAAALVVQGRALASARARIAAMEATDAQFRAWMREAEAADYRAKPEA